MSHHNNQYRLRPRLNELDEDKVWLVETTADSIVWFTLFEGTYKECYDYWKKAINNQKDKEE